MEQNERELLLRKFAEANRKLMQVNEQLATANQKLKEYEAKAQKAEQASRMKSLFLANMSHEIRTPLNAIEGFSRILAETDSYEERQGFYEIIESNSNRLMSLIDEILDLSRVESGEIAIKKSMVDLSQMGKNIKQLFKFRCPETVDLVFNKPDMPVVMNTDENRLIQVFSNLISNALKHTPKGIIKYGFHLDDEARNIKFYVSDSGSGIDPDFLPHIFDTYASQDAEQQKGYGLGLALCRIIVEKMGGYINVESTLGEGSTFTFELPFQGTIGGMSTSTRTNTTNVRTIRMAAGEQANMKTILVAEDEESNYELVRIVLQKRYKLIRARNGIEAVTLNEEEKPDMILMDIRMPDMNGLDATRIIKEVRHDVPVIALSAYAFDENIRDAKAAGCDAFMAKPFRVEDLIEICEKYTQDK
jgi:CheY-like chemotaxis protein/nitrogen-specific signal transduction histidine kinase